MSDLSKIVTVLTLQEVTPVKLPYTIYVNASLSAIKEYALEHPNVYVIVLYMSYDVAVVEDWNEALGKKWATRVLSPVWAANVEEMELYTNHFLTLDGMTKDDWEVVCTC